MRMLCMKRLDNSSYLKTEDDMREDAKEGVHSDGKENW